jgi:hypothetical protein
MGGEEIAPKLSYPTHAAEKEATGARPFLNFYHCSDANGLQVMDDLPPLALSHPRNLHWCGTCGTKRRQRVCCVISELIMVAVAVAAAASHYHRAMNRIT